MNTTAGLIGLGKMGLGMARRLREAELSVVAWDPDDEALEAARALGVEIADDVAGVVAAVPAGGSVWSMVPPGDATRAVVATIVDSITAPIIVVDSGNSHFRDAAVHHESCRSVGAEFVDVGVSGGQWGWKTGYGLMVGASEEAYAVLGPVLDALAGDSAHMRVGQCGAGHLVKAIHNGVQYAVMQAYAEGFALLESHDDVDTVRAMSAWQNGSSVRSWLLEQMLAAVAENPALDDVSPVVPDSGMGRWTAEEAIKAGVPTPVLTAALYARFHSQVDPRAERLLRASRSQIGGQK